MVYIYWIGAMFTVFYVCARLAHIFTSEHKILEIFLMAFEVFSTICISAFLFLFFDVMGILK